MNDEQRPLCVPAVILYVSSQVADDVVALRFGKSVVDQVLKHDDSNIFVWDIQFVRDGVGVNALGELTSSEHYLKAVGGEGVLRGVLCYFSFRTRLVLIFRIFDRFTLCCIVSEVVDAQHPSSEP